MILCERCPLHAHQGGLVNAVKAAGRTAKQQVAAARVMNPGEFGD